MNTAPLQRIVLIDDEPGVLKALTLLLQTMGYQVLAFNGPQEALTYLRAGVDPDLILSDQRMPGLSGSELFRTLRALSINAPFVLMSGHAQESDVREVLQAGSTAFLPKPFTPVSLKEALEGALTAGVRARAS
jgi:CheY-like chemotaxis protein